MGVLTMNTNMTLSVLGLYNYDDSIFSTMQLPEDVDRDILIDNILMECAELEVLYPDSDFMKTAINRWSAKEVNIWSKLNEIWNTEIDVSNEYDYKRLRTANLSHSKTGTETEVPTGSIIDSGTVGSTTTDSVSAYNSSTFENRQQSVVSGTNGNTRSYSNYQQQTTYNTTDSDTGTDTITETGHKTPVYELIKQASEVAIYNIYDYITESFKERFCLMIY